MTIFYLQYHEGILLFCSFPKQAIQMIREFGIEDLPDFFYKQVL